MLDCFYGAEAEQFTFYRIPKVFFADEHFRSMSAEAKILYGLLLDRMGLSVKNGWLDSEGRVYIIFTVEENLEALGCATQKAANVDLDRRVVVFDIHAPSELLKPAGLLDITAYHALRNAQKRVQISGRSVRLAARQMRTQKAAQTAARTAKVTVKAAAKAAAASPLLYADGSSSTAFADISRKVLMNACDCLLTTKKPM